MTNDKVEGNNVSEVKEEILRESHQFSQNNRIDDSDEHKSLHKPQFKGDYNRLQNENKWVQNDNEQKLESQLKKHEYEQKDYMHQLQDDYNRIQNENKRFQNDNERKLESQLKKHEYEQKDYLHQLQDDYNRIQNENKRLQNDNEQKLESQLKKHGYEQKDYMHQLQDDYNRLQNEFKRLQNEYEQKLESQRKHYEDIIKRNKHEYEQNFQDLNQKLREELNKERQNCEGYVEGYKNQISDVQNELSDLEKTNTALRKEASKYQSALGVAANFRMSDDDKNHPVQLKDDILSLQDNIERYVTNLKGKIEINIENVKILLQRYGCLTEITAENPNRPLIKAVLQRHVLDVIFENATNYFSYSGEIMGLESEIRAKMFDLCSVLNKFSETRNGTDAITPTSSIKIRQEACAALSNRGFSEVMDNSQLSEHGFIPFVRHILNESMNSNRIIIDQEKKRSVENMSTNIIREVVRIFWFRLCIQEPIVTSFWVPHDRIDPSTMTGSWEKEEDIDNLVVDLCYFPMIGLNLEDDPSKRKLYTRAKVFPRYQEKNYSCIPA